MLRGYWCCWQLPLLLLALRVAPVYPQTGNRCPKQNEAWDETNKRCVIVNNQCSFACQISGANACIIGDDVAPGCGGCTSACSADAPGFVCEIGCTHTYPSLRKFHCSLSQYNAGGGVVAKELDCTQGKTVSSLGNGQFLSVPRGVRPQFHKVTDGSVFNSQVQDLKKLTIAKHAITVLRSGDFDGLGKCPHPACVGAGAFEWLNPSPDPCCTDGPRLGLRTLELANNGIVRVEVGALAALDALLVLDLSHNRIDSLPVAAFAGMRSLLSLRLDSNPLTALTADVFSPLKSLTSLEMRDSALSALPLGLFAGLGALRTLELDGNALMTTLPAAVFAPLRSLDTLYLDHNALASIPPAAFSGLVSLRTLFLDDNALAALPPTVFAPLSRLERLSARRNALRTLSGRQFARNPGLQRLELQGNTLLTVEPGVFDGLAALRAAHLEHNRIEYLPPALFRDASGLEYLSLHNNSMRAAGLPLDVFDGLVSLKQLRLDSNPSWEYFCPLPTQCSIVVAEEPVGTGFNRECVCDGRLCAGAGSARPRWAVALLAVATATRAHRWYA
eukprot:g6018.t1